MPGVEIEEYNVQREHIHLMVTIAPKYSVAEVVKQMKGFTSRVLRMAVPWFRKRYSKKKVLWSPGYFVSTIGIDETTIRNYIKYQQDLDSGQAFLDL